MADDQAVRAQEGVRVMAGRKNKYDSHIKPNMNMIIGYLNGGHTEASVAKRFGVSVSTWELYKLRKSEFSEAIKNAGMNATALVVNALHKRATGYEYDEIHTEITDTGAQHAQAGQPLAQRRVIRKITKHVPPDTAAGIYWTTNRDPDNWKNTQNIKHSGEIKNAGVLMVAPPMSKEEWLKQNQNVKAEEPDGQEKKK